MRDEVVSEAPSARTFSDSVIDLSSMETVPAEHLPAGADRAENDGGKQIESMRVGDRHRIFLQRRWSRVQLLWRSDRSLFFLFAGESPSRILTRSPDAPSSGWPRPDWSSRSRPGRWCSAPPTG